MYEEFNKTDYKKFFELLDIPASYRNIRVDKRDYDVVAEHFIGSHFSLIDLSEKQIENLGKIIYKVCKANKKNKKLVERAMSKIKKDKMKKKQSKGIKVKSTIRSLREKAINESIDISDFYYMNETLKTVHGVRLSKEAERWHEKVKLLGMRSFKTAWFKNIKGPADVVDTEYAVSTKVKYYFNEPLISIPEETLKYLKKHYSDFEPGFYEYLEYLFDKIEMKKREKDEDYVLKRVVFMVTSANSIEDIEIDRNIIAIHTDGYARPTYKGTPEFLDQSDIKKMKDFAKNYPTIPIQQAAAQGMM